MKTLSESVLSWREILTGLLRSQEYVEAVLLYGSVARGDAEPYSDIDLLVLCPAGQKRAVYDDLNTMLSRSFERVSLSVYSKKEMNFLAKAKSLFLLHLSRESVMLLDQTGWTTNLITNFEPKQSYDDDFKKSLELLTPLQSIVLHAPNQLHRLAYAYSLFRVFGVYLLAARRVFEFSKARMAQCLIQAYPHELQDIKSLSDLRVLNANFFSGGKPFPGAWSSAAGMPAIQSSVAALARLVGLKVAVNVRLYDEVVNEFVDAAMSHALRLGYRLRTWFLLLVYDGINLYFKKKYLPALTSFSESHLIRLVASDDVPEPVRKAASLGVEYLRNYPLKYFLLEDSKIATHDACSSLCDLGRLVRML